MKTYNLVSYCNLLTEKEDRKLETIKRVVSISDNVLLDCGAFSLFTKKVVDRHYKKITIENYISFVKQIINSGIEDKIRYIHFDYVNNEDPDYIKKSNRGYEIMTSEGLNPVPVFRVNDNFKTLDKWFNKDNDLISIAGLVYMKNSIRLSYLKSLKKRYGKLCNKFHLLGYADIKGIEYLRPYSADSTSWSDPTFFYYKKSRLKYRYSKGHKNIRHNYKIKIMKLKSIIPKNIWNEIDNIIFKNNRFISHNPDIELRYLSIILFIKILTERKIIHSLGVKTYFVTGKPTYDYAKINKEASDFMFKLKLENCLFLNKEISRTLK